ncbi:hypothetical protein B0J11DRAFT_576338 [Dendryphion nanum]|uniref:Uncharacterized protein n=1 Tax=Dendryphion nanum TaxID=256645 RepID=A0A9P9EE24_9PLEO|nr:hypothetical protein B0J11DRAFT_576338 [Dendryphion nanum]
MTSFTATPTFAQSATLAQAHDVFSGSELEECKIQVCKQRLAAFIHRNWMIYPSRRALDTIERGLRVLNEVHYLSKSIDNLSIYELRDLLPGDPLSTFTHLQGEYRLVTVMDTIRRLCWDDAWALYSVFLYASGTEDWMHDSNMRRRSQEFVLSPQLWLIEWGLDGLLDPEYDRDMDITERFRDMEEEWLLWEADICLIQVDTLSELTNQLEDWGHDMCVAECRRRVYF